MYSRTPRTLWASTTMAKTTASSYHQDAPSGNGGKRRLRPTTGPAAAPATTTTTTREGSGGERRRRRRKRVQEVGAETDLNRFYLAQLRRGVAPTLKELQTESRRLGLRRTRKQLTDMRFDYEFMAVRTPFRRTSAYVGSQVDKLGNLFLDMGEFGKSMRVSNGGKRYILVGVDALSQRLAVVPLANKSQAAWEAGVTRMIERDFPLVRSIVTDLDTAVAGKAFQAKIRLRHGIRWYHLRQRSKSFKAENMIGYVKRRLGLALAANGDRNWVRHVASVVDDYNSRPVSGTTVARSAVTKANELEVLAEKLGVEDLVPHVNSRLIKSMSPATRAAVGFRYAAGDRVLLANKANYETVARLEQAASGGGAFAKTSVVGSYGSKVYVVSSAFLKANRTHYIPVYGLEKMEGVYYAGDLKPATFAGSGAAADASRQERQAAKDAAVRKAAAKRRLARLARA